MSVEQAAITVLPRAPFCTFRTWEIMSRSKILADEVVLGERTLQRAFRIGGTTQLITVSSPGTIESPRLEVRITSAKELEEAAVKAGVRALEDFLSAHDNLSEFYSLGGEDEHFSWILDLLYGYHQVRFGSAFESACWAILSANTPMPVALKLKRSLKEAANLGIKAEGKRFLAFPEAKDNLKLGEGELARALGSVKRARYLQGAASAFAEIEPEFLRSGPYEEVRTWLMDIDGIGPWSASLIMIRGLGRMEELPVGDKALLKAASWAYDKPVNEAELTRIAARYKGWKGYWAHYLRVAEELKEK